MDELINLHKQDMHRLVEKMKASGKLPPLFAFVASNMIEEIGMRALIEIPVSPILLADPRPHSEVLSAMFDGLLHTEADNGVVKSSHMILGLPVITESYSMKDDEWLEHQKVMRAGRKLNREQVQQMAAEGKVAFAYMTVATTGFVVTSMGMPSANEVEFMDTNIHPFEGGKFDGAALKAALAKIIDERPHVWSRGEAVTEDGK
jgi:hypothetical protein